MPSANLRTHIIHQSRESLRKSEATGENLPGSSAPRKSEVLGILNSDLKLRGKYYCYGLHENRPLHLHAVEAVPLRIRTHMYIASFP